MHVHSTGTVHFLYILLLLLFMSRWSLTISLPALCRRPTLTPISISSSIHCLLPSHPIPKHTTISIVRILRTYKHPPNSIHIPPFIYPLPTDPSPSPRQHHKHTPPVHPPASHSPHSLSQPTTRRTRTLCNQSASIRHASTNAWHGMRMARSLHSTVDCGLWTGPRCLSSRGAQGQAIRD